MTILKYLTVFDLIVSWNCSYVNEDIQQITGIYERRITFEIPNVPTWKMPRLPFADYVMYPSEKWWLTSNGYCNAPSSKMQQILLLTTETYQAEKCCNLLYWILECTQLNNGQTWFFCLLECTQLKDAETCIADWWNVKSWKMVQLTLLDTGIYPTEKIPRLAWWLLESANLKNAVACFAYNWNVGLPSWNMCDLPSWLLGWT